MWVLSLPSSPSTAIFWIVVSKALRTPCKLGIEALIATRVCWMAVSLTDGSVPGSPALAEEWVRQSLQKAVSQPSCYSLQFSPWFIHSLSWIVSYIVVIENTKILILISKLNKHAEATSGCMIFFLLSTSLFVRARLTMDVFNSLYKGVSIPSIYGLCLSFFVEFF